jgi:hypothetical protein
MLNMDPESVQHELEGLKAKMTPIEDAPLGSDRTDDYEKPLCGNYNIVRTNADEVVIQNPRFRPITVDVGEIGNPGFHTWTETSFTGNVRKLAVKAPYVTGYTSVLHGDENPDAKEHAGFFLINTATDAIKRGLTEQQWRAELEQIGWQNPELVLPK